MAQVTILAGPERRRRWSDEQREGILVEAFQSGARVGVSAASAIRWQQLAAQHGTPEPQRQGGDRRSARIETHADLILDAWQATPDITLAELQALLADHGTDVAIGTLWRFFDRRGITRKKRPPTRPSRTVPTS